MTDCGFMAIILLIVCAIMTLVALLVAAHEDMWFDKQIGIKPSFKRSFMSCLMAAFGRDK